MKKHFLLVLLLFGVATAFTSCKKDDVTPMPAKTHLSVTMDSGGEQPPQQPPPPPNIP